MIRAPRGGFGSKESRPELVMEVLTNIDPACQSGAKLQRDDNRPVEWRIFDAPLGYEEALALMDERVAAIAAGEAPEAV